MQQTERERATPGNGDRAREGAKPNSDRDVQGRAEAQLKQQEAAARQREAADAAMQQQAIAADQPPPEPDNRLDQVLETLGAASTACCKA